MGRLPEKGPKREATLMERALRLLARRARSEAELRERLRAAPSATDGRVTAVIERLKQLGFLNDGLFARHAASSKLRIRPMGRARLERDLRMRKIPARTIRGALDEVYQETSEADQLDRALQRLLELRGLPRSREDSKKLYDRLIRLGFAHDPVMERIRACTGRGQIDPEE